MGLDISAYVNATPAPDANPNDFDSVARASVESAHVAQADGIEHGALFTFDKEIRFRAGSYSGYNRFREELAGLVGYVPQAAWSGQVSEESPFYPMVNFSDCEGTLGPQTCARLAKDFADHQDKADEIGGYFAEAYSQWRRAFEEVAGNGFVSFH
jgi:hypothetical protein